MLNILIFLILALIIIEAGKKLSICGDKLGDIMGLEKSWIGVVMLASITSLPELITSTAATIIGEPEMAVSNIFGSNLFNVFIIFILDIFFIKNSFSSSIGLKNYLSCFSSILLTSIFFLGFVFGDLSLGGISLISIGIFLLYLVVMNLIYKLEHGRVFVDPIEENPEDSIVMSAREAKLGFAMSGLIVVAVGIALSNVADRIAETPIMGISLGESFVGVILLALATSLPELTVSIQAIKMKSYNMAAGNILGSNIFNIAIIFVVDLCYREGSLFDTLGEFHLISAISSILILLTLMIGMLFKEKRRKVDSWIIGGIYIAAMYILYIKR